MKTDLLTNWLTPWSGDLFEKLRFCQLVKKLSEFYRTLMFITTFTNACHLSLSRVKSVQFMPLYSTSWISSLLLSFHLRLCLPSVSFRQVTHQNPVCISLSAVRAAFLKILYTNLLPSQKTGLDCPRWGWSFSHPSWPALGPTQPSIKWVPGHSQGLQRPGCGVNHSYPSCTEVKEKVKL